MEVLGMVIMLIASIIYVHMLDDVASSCQADDGIEDV
jgi:hypothetical protein